MNTNDAKRQCSTKWKNKLVNRC